MASVPDRTPLLDGSYSEDNPKPVTSAQRTLTFLLLTASLCLAGAANDVLSKVVANTYTQRYAFFVDQGNNIVYAFFSGLPVLWLWFRGAIPEDTRQCPQRKFAFMGLLDALGTYFSSVGAVHTPGQLQIVLGQALIPISMLASAALLSSRYTVQEVASAAVVFAGACAAVGPAVFAGDMLGAQCWPPAIAVYASSNFPMALSNVYKELGFSDMQLDVFCLTFVVVVYQTMISFGLLLLQTMPYLSGSPEGLSLSTAWEDFVGGSMCFIGVAPEDGSIDCSWAGPLLVAYVVVNLGFNVIGLLLVKAGSDLRVGAVLCSLAYAVKLPVSTLLFSSPMLMGTYAEPICVATWVGLVLVLVGFLWHVHTGQQRVATEQAALEEVIAYTVTDAEMLRTPGSTHVAFEEPWAFHERVVGCVSTSVVRSKEAKGASSSRSRSPSPSRGKA